MRFVPIAVCAALMTSCVTPTTQQALTPAFLVGTWDVSLRYDPNAPPSKTEMLIVKVDDGALTGTFYGTAFEEGRIASSSTSLVIAARTGDQSGAYWHSGRLQADGSIEGQTISEGRDFLMTWRAVKK